MPVDYSKWDALELSDDSDIEVHPNVDKRSFIRAKQNQIHQERQHRRHQIATLKYERIINDGLLQRIDRLLTALKSHKPSDQSADELVFQSLIESAGDMAEDQPPPPPEGVHTHVTEKPTYSKMMATLVDQVRKEVDESGAEDRLERFIQGITKEREKVDGLQKELLKKLTELEREEKRHITSDDIHTGFDVSHVSKAKPAAPSTTESTKKPTNKTVELLNPSRPTTTRTSTGDSSGFEADIERGSSLDDTPAAAAAAAAASTSAADDDDDDEHTEPTALGKEFAKILPGDFRASHQFISAHPSVLAERETDGLLVAAFDAALAGRDAQARQCVHQALLLQYCRQLGGRDGAALFFRRVTTRGHQAQKLFADDVNDTYARIRARAREIAAERAAARPDGAEGAAGGGGAREVEQIQLHAVDPNTSINIRVPPADAQDEAEQAARRIFDAFPPGLRRALESGSLEEVNKVLGKMSVEEAEEVVGQLGEGGMLSLEEGVIDATTEEGRRRVEEIERAGRMDVEVGEEEGVAGLAEDPE